MGKGDRARGVYLNVNTMDEKPGMQTFSQAYSAKVAAVVGIVHIICGLTALAANTIGIMCGANIPLAAGIWSSVFFIASGSLAIAGAHSTTKRLVVSTLVMFTIKKQHRLSMEPLFKSINHKKRQHKKAAREDDQHQSSGILLQVMAIISSLAAWLLLLISSFSLAENRKSFSASDSIWLEVETEKSFARSTAAVSNMTTTLKPADENFLREKAVHDMRTGVYTTEVGVGLVMLLAATLSAALTCHPLCCRGCRSKTLSKRACPSSSASSSLPESARLTIPPELPPPYQAKTL